MTRRQRKEFRPSRHLSIVIYILVNVYNVVSLLFGEKRLVSIKHISYIITYRNYAYKFSLYDQNK